MNRLSHSFQLLLFSLILLLPMVAHCQIVSSHGVFDPDSVRQDWSNQPYFSLYKDNYFVIGPPLFYGKPNAHNTDVKFQISVQQRLTNATLPGGTYLYLFYSQKCFWNVLEESLPMTDLNFNPGIGICKPLFVKNRYIGKLSMMIEHESNGKDSIASRSWNKISFAGNIMLTPNINIAAKFWIPIIDGENNRDILKYCGICQASAQYVSDNRRFSAGLTLVKREGWDLSYNTIVELAYRFTPKENQCIFLQYYNGYGEGLLDYKVFKSQIRIGIVIRPKLFSDF